LGAPLELIPALADPKDLFSQLQLREQPERLVLQAA
jgi:hypothetical protein